MIQHAAKWFSAPPFWSGPESTVPTERASRMTRPAILRFATDSFMDDFLATLDRDATGLRSFAVSHETWRRPPTVQASVTPEERIEREPAQARSLARLRRTIERRAGRVA